MEELRYIHDYEEVLEHFEALVLSVLLSLVIGFVQRHLHAEEKVRFGTARTFAFIGLCGYVLYMLMPAEEEQVPLLYLVGMLGIVVWLTVFYVYKIRDARDYGITTFVIALLTYAIGPMLYESEMDEEAVVLVVLVVLVVVLLLLLERLKTFFRELFRELV